MEIEWLTSVAGLARTWVFTLTGDLGPLRLGNATKVCHTDTAVKNADSLTVTRVVSTTVRHKAEHVLHIGLAKNMLVVIMAKDDQMCHVRDRVKYFVASKGGNVDVLGKCDVMDSVHMSELGHFALDEPFLNPSSSTSTTIALSEPSSSAIVCAADAFAAIKWLGDPPSKLLAYKKNKMSMERRIIYVQGRSGKELPELREFAEFFVQVSRFNDANEYGPNMLTALKKAYELAGGKFIEQSSDARAAAQYFASGKLKEYCMACKKEVFEGLDSGICEVCVKIICKLCHMPMTEVAFTHPADENPVNKKRRVDISTLKKECDLQELSTDMTWEKYRDVNQNMHCPGFVIRCQPCATEKRRLGEARALYGKGLGDGEMWQNKRKHLTELEGMSDAPGIEYKRIMCTNADCKPFPAPKLERVNGEDPEFFNSMLTRIC